MPQWKFRDEICGGHTTRHLASKSGHLNCVIGSAQMNDLKSNMQQIKNIVSLKVDIHGMPEHQFAWKPAYMYYIEFLILS